MAYVNASWGLDIHFRKIIWWHQLKIGIGCYSKKVAQLLGVGCHIQLGFGQPRLGLHGIQFDLQQVGLRDLTNLIPPAGQCQQRVCVCLVALGSLCIELADQQVKENMTKPG